jgi:threonine dehydrogenase-like Zn-dependent dehydrogenase
VHALRIDRPHEAGIVELPVPRPAPDEVLVRVAAAGVCGSDLELLHGTRPTAYVRYPIVPGHEWSGVVAEVGPAVCGIEPGDPVVAEGIRSCGRCSRCWEGRPNLCLGPYAETGFTHAGAFAEYVVVPAQLVHLLPRGASLETAALLEPASCVASGLLEADLRPGMDIAVVGAGTLGLLAVCLFRLATPSRLAVLDIQPDRLARSRDLGAGEGWTSGSELDPALFGKFDLVFEATGREGGAATALALARRGGTVILEGIAGGDGAAVDADCIALGHLRLQGIFGASSSSWNWMVDLFGRGEVDFGPLITHRFRLGEYQKAFQALQEKRGDVLKVVLIP